MNFSYCPCVAGYGGTCSLSGNVLHDLQGFVDMFGGVHLVGEDMADDPCFIDHIGHAPRQKAERCGNAVLFAQGPILITQEDEGQLVLGGELLLCFFGIGTDAHHFRASLLKDLVIVPE